MRRAILLFLSALLIAHLLDGWAWQQLYHPDADAHDWHRLLRICGFWPTWLVVGAAMALQTRARRPAGALVLSAGLSGVAAEVAKLLVRRERPGPDGQYIFRSFTDDPLSTAALGMPSSHAAVAFGAAWVLGTLFPRPAPVFVALAIGCALSRLTSRAHFLSDVVAAAGLAWLVAAGVRRLVLRGASS